MDTTVSQATARPVAFDGTPAARRQPSARALLRWRTPVFSRLTTIWPGRPWLRVRCSAARTRRPSHPPAQLGLDPNCQYRVPSFLYLPPSFWRG
jgi:hypothetical protein